MLRSILPRVVCHRLPSNTPRWIACRANSTVIIDVVVGIIAFGVISDVHSTLQKKKNRPKKEELFEVIEPTVLEEEEEEKEDKKTSRQQKDIVDIEIE